MYDKLTENDIKKMQEDSHGRITFLRTGTANVPDVYKRQAIGSAGMTESFSEDSTQPVITYYCTETQSADTTITLTDSDGSALFTVCLLYTSRCV